MTCEVELSTPSFQKARQLLSGIHVSEPHRIDRPAVDADFLFNDTEDFGLFT